MLIDHASPHTTSHTCYKGVGKKKGTAVFNGEIAVSKQAQKTEAHQQHHGWLLERDAHIYARPQLAIQTDDVICTHGATTRKVDQAVLHYLHTRGLSLAEAQRLLLHAFFQEIFEKIPDENLSAALYKEFVADSSHTSG